MNSDEIKDINNLININCHIENTEILMYNGELKKVQDVQIGDLFFNSDSKPIKVKKIIKGVDKMYNIINSYNLESYTVNQDFILSLKYVGYKRMKLKYSSFIIYWFDNINICEKTIQFKFNKETRPYVQIYAKIFFNSIQEIKNIDISINDFLKLPDSLKSKFKMLKYTACFPKKDVMFDPYMFGSMDGINIYNMVENAIIPDMYKYNSILVRLEYIAGVIDNYGYICDNSYKIDIYNDSKYSKDLQFIIKSLNIDILYKKYEEHISPLIENNVPRHDDILYTIILYGHNINRIPVKINTIQNRQKKILFHDIIIEEKLYDNHICYGFEFDNKEKYILDNFIISNSCY